MLLPCVVTIAGSDSSGGAGIEADLKTFSAMQTYGACVITAVTAQDTRGVREIVPIPARLVELQLETVLRDLPIKAAKIGMLFRSDIAESVAKAIRSRDIPIVVDPVLKAGSGDSLIEATAGEVLLGAIFPLASLITPNLSEAEELCGFKIVDLETMVDAAKAIMKRGPKAVLIKGGKFSEEEVIDLLYSSRGYKPLRKRRLDVNAHGAGCTLSSAIAALLAQGLGLEEAVSRAEFFMEGALRFSLSLGGGRNPVHQFVHLYNDAQRWDVAKNVRDAAKRVVAESRFLPHIARVGTQVAMALPYAYSEDQVAAIEGRITRVRGRAKMGEVEFGPSTHMSNVVLAAMRHSPSVRAVMNLHYDRDLVEVFRSRGSKVSSFDRSEEPREVKEVEGRSLRWGTEEAIRKAGLVPDVIFDLGEEGREPMIRVLGASAMEVVEKASSSIELLEKGFSRRARP